MTTRQKVNTDAGMPVQALKNVKSKPQAKPADIFSTVADVLAIENNGQVLRWRVEDQQLIVLLVDGRKFYIDLNN